MIVNKDTIIKDIILFDKRVAKILMRNDLHCLSCPFIMNESLEQACILNDLDLDKIIFEINEYFKENVNEEKWTSFITSCS